MEKPEGDFWVFGYGSLMWHPNFLHAETRPALLRGYHRALCIYSVEYRGTVETPGLVFGLDRGGSCRGLAFRVLKKNAEEVMDYLFEREMVTNVYRPRWGNISTTTDTGLQNVKSLLFVADPSHQQYTGKLSDDDIVRTVLQGHGKAGPCIDYLTNTFDHLQELGIHDHALSRIIKKAITAGQSV
jgi:cation transport protein ChaC